jgi:hypothetical protein
LPAMYFFLWGHAFSFIHSGISETASRFLIPDRSVLAINLKNLFGYNTQLGADANK